MRFKFKVNFQLMPFIESSLRIEKCFKNIQFSGHLCNLLILMDGEWRTLRFLHLLSCVVELLLMISDNKPLKQCLRGNFLQQSRLWVLLLGLLRLSLIPGELGNQS
jgi:hypothetical protein